MIKSEPAKVLIADDEDDTRQFLLEFLRELGHNIIAVSGGAQALEMAKTQLPDVILLDVMMPGMTGLEACQALKEDPTTRDIPVIFVTAKATVNDQIKGLHAGAHDYINKPYRITELAARVNAAVKAKKMHDELKRTGQQYRELTQTLHQICQPLEKSQELTQQLLNDNQEQVTHDSLEQLAKYLTASLTQLRTLLPQNEPS